MPDDGRHHSALYLPESVVWDSEPPRLNVIPLGSAPFGFGHTDTYSVPIPDHWHIAKTDVVTITVTIRTQETPS